jgi:hypothetical protein
MRRNGLKSANAWLDKIAEKITGAVGSMWCAIIFMCISLISLPDVIKASLESGSLMHVVQWLTQSFLQLVLLSIILKGQNIAGAKQEQIVRQINENTARTEAAAERIEYIVSLIDKKEEKELKELEKKQDVYLKMVRM